MTSQRRHSRSTDKYSLGSPAEWIADGHVTCNIQCSGAKCDRRLVDVRLDTLPQALPWSTISRRLVCKECGVKGSVHIVPNWHDRIGSAGPFTRHWKTLCTSRRRASLDTCPPAIGVDEPSQVTAVSWLLLQPCDGENDRHPFYFSVYGSLAGRLDHGFA
jgi:hypothetical protein